MTWSHDHNLDFFWPLKFLPLEPGINEARILTFGYNADFRLGSGKNKMSILDFAKALLYDLKYALDESASELEDLNMGEVRISTSLHFSRAFPSERKLTSDAAAHHLRGSLHGRSDCERGNYDKSQKTLA